MTHHRELLICTAVVLTFFMGVPAALAKKPKPATRKVLMLVFNPRFEGQNQTLIDFHEWNDPQALAYNYIADVRSVSGGYVNYEVVETLTLDAYPIKQDGYVYTDDSYARCLIDGDCHEPAFADYARILSDYGVCDGESDQPIDELWLWGGPHFGFYDAVVVGADMPWISAPALDAFNCNRTLTVLGFDYSRGINDMLENLGHRIDAIMQHVYGRFALDESTAWNKFALHWGVSDTAHCGKINIAPNTATLNEWDHPRYVSSDCDNWLDYPRQHQRPKRINCQEWGCTEYGYKRWWLSHIPNSKGQTRGIWNNWWFYVISPDKVPAGNL